MEPVYTPIVNVIITGFKVMGWDLHVTGLEHIPRKGAGVLACNHISYLDFVFVGFGAKKIGRLVRFMAKQEAFDHRLTGPFMRAMKHIPVDRLGRRADSLEAAADALRAGEVVGMFPEGTISRSFVPMKGHTGAARMAIDTRAPLIPTAVWGSQRLLTKGRPRDLRRGVAISLAYGEPIPHTPDSDPREVTRELMEAMRGLVDKLAASYPQKPSGPDDTWWVPAHLGGAAPTLEEVAEMAKREAEEQRRKRKAAGESATDPR